MTDEKKICPIILSVGTEGVSVGLCSIELIARKNADGHIPV